LQTGDNVLAINDHEIVNYSDLRKYFLEAQVITIERNGEEQKIDLPEDFLGRLSTSKSRGFLELRFPFVIGKVADSSLNKGAGLKKGDIVLSINNQELKYFDQLAARLQNLKNQSIEVEILRGDNKITKTLQVDDNGKLGVYAGGSYSDIEKLGYYDIVEKQYSLGESFGVGLTRFKNQIGSYWMQLKLIFTPSTGAYKGVGGFKAIFDIFPDTWSWQAFWGITAFLSIMLGVLNLLPIPALDGGHVVFLLYEMVSGKKPSDKFMEYAQMVGFFLLIALVLLANGNDIFKAIFN